MEHLDGMSVFRPEIMRAIGVRSQVQQVLLVLHGKTPHLESLSTNFSVLRIAYIAFAVRALTCSLHHASRFVRRVPVLQCLQMREGDGMTKMIIREVEARRRAKCKDGRHFGAMLQVCGCRRHDAPPM